MRIKPLKGLTYYDKTELINGKPTKKIEDRDKVDVTNWTDSVYESAPGVYEIGWPGGSVEVTTTNMRDLVVWNPSSDYRPEKLLQWRKADGTCRGKA